tara:strand:- start:2915 stop:3256 length:342 start_codon:yes stop_codon:yes gene_type:complete
MVKMRQLKNPGDAFYTEDPSWFWSTFEFNDNPGVQHVRMTLISQRAPLSNKRIASILKTAGITDSRFQAFAPNGTHPIHRERDRHDAGDPRAYRYGGFRRVPQHGATGLLDPL